MYKATIKIIEHRQYYDMSYDYVIKRSYYGETIDKALQELANNVYYRNYPIIVEQVADKEE